MKKINSINSLRVFLIALIALMGVTSANAQIIKVYKGKELVDTYKNTAENQFEVEFDEEYADPNMLSGSFSVSANKKVNFTKSNLYWDGSAFKFEANQYDYPTSWNADHVGHFYWTKTAANSYAQSYSDGTITTSDVSFFAESTGGLTVEGTEGLYALSKEEWTYLINTRANASSLYKYSVTVAGKTNCLIIAPDGYDYATNPLQSSYDETAWAAAEAKGLICLPAAGYRDTNSINQTNNFGSCWSSTPVPNDKEYSYRINFYRTGLSPNASFDRKYGFSLRLVK